MDYFSIKNWEHFQQYKDRDPKWIKLYRLLLDDYEFDELADNEKWHLVGIWLLSAKLGNKVPYDDKWVAKRIGAKTKVNLSRYVQLGYILVEESVQNCTELYESVPREDLDKNKIRTKIEEIEKVFTHYQNYHPKAQLGKDKKDKIKGRLDENYSVEQLTKAIDGCHLDPFHMGENKTGQKWNQLTLILRDSAHVDKFIEIAENPPQQKGSNDAAQAFING